MHKKNLDLFNAWIEGYYPKILRQLQATQEVDMDAIHDAYLRMATGKLKDIPAITFPEAFLKEYNHFRTRNFNESFTTSHPDEIFFDLLTGNIKDPEDCDNEKEASRNSLAIKITKFIGAAFSSQEKAIWSMRLKGFSIRAIADAQGIPERRVKEVTQNITTRTQKQFSKTI